MNLSDLVKQAEAQQNVNVAVDDKPKSIGDLISITLKEKNAEKNHFKNMIEESEKCIVHLKSTKDNLMNEYSEDQIDEWILDQYENIEYANEKLKTL